MTKLIAVLTSGGDAPGMNAAVRAVVRRAIWQGWGVFGIRRGFAGLVDWDVLELNLSSVGDVIQRGGTVLQTARYDPWRLSPAAQRQGYENLVRASVDGVVVLGGNGSMRGAEALNTLGMPTVAVPASIDHDVARTEEAIGFDTAVNTVVEMVDRIRDTASAHGRVFVIEVMGRNCGRLALSAAVAAGAESVLVPERPIDLEAVTLRIHRRNERGKRHHLILVAEGAAHAYQVAEYIHAHSALETKVTVLGHIQRGGSPTARDRILSSQMGGFAVEALRDGRVNVMTSVGNGKLVLEPLPDVNRAPLPQLSEDLWNLVEMLSI